MHLSHCGYVQSEYKITFRREESIMAVIVVSKLQAVFFHQRTSGRFLLGAAECPLSPHPNPHVRVKVEPIQGTPHQNSQLGKNA